MADSCFVCKLKESRCYSICCSNKCYKLIQDKEIKRICLNCDSEFLSKDHTHNARCGGDKTCKKLREFLSKAKEERKDRHLKIDNTSTSAELTLVEYRRSIECLRNILLRNSKFISNPQNTSYQKNIKTIVLYREEQMSKREFRGTKDTKLLKDLLLADIFDYYNTIYDLEELDKKTKEYIDSQSYIRISTKATSNYNTINDSLNTVCLDGDFLDTLDIRRNSFDKDFLAKLNGRRFEDDEDIGDNSLYNRKFNPYNSSGEIKLLKAIIFQAIIDIKANMDHRSELKIAKEDAKQFLSKDNKLFRAYCELLDLDHASFDLNSVNLDQTRITLNRNNSRND